MFVVESIKVIDVKTIYFGPIAVEQEVSIELPKAECDELRKALGIVGKYRKLALQYANHKDKNSDWTEVGFAVKSDKVIVNVRYGMAG